MNLKEKIRIIPGFPKPGISFKDITTLLADAEAFQFSVRTMADQFRQANLDGVIGVESRGFLIGAPLAYELGLSFSMIRKQGKLPAEVIRAEYDLEYGTDSLEIHKDALSTGDRIVLVDDLLATGGTVKAAAELIEELGGHIVGCAFLMELSYLNGREKLADYDVFSLVQYND